MRVTVVEDVFILLKISISYIASRFFLKHGLTFGRLMKRFPLIFGLPLEGHGGSPINFNGREPQGTKKELAMDWETEPPNVCVNCIVSLLFAGAVGLFFFSMADPRELGPFGLPINYIAGALGFLLAMSLLAGIRNSWADSRQHVKSDGRQTIASGVKINFTEVLSAIIMFAAVLGSVIGYVFPGKLTGAILPAALIAWYILSKIIEHNEK